jgi:enoyl-CoA hydratase/carnithine racemase
MSNHYLLDVADGVAVVTLNRPEAMNSINRELRLQLLELFPALDLRDDVSVIVLTGAGDKAFCTGADLKERAGRTTADMVQDRHYVIPRFTVCVSSVSKPVIAAVKGYCMGGGFELVLQCDISIAADNAIFALPEVTHGFFPGGGACQRLPRLIGYQKAKELILTGRRFDAQEAKELAIINRIVPADQVMAEALAMAKKIAAYPSMGVIQAKRAMNQSLEVSLAAGLRFDDEAWIACMHSDAWKEKLGEFARKERKS